MHNVCHVISGMLRRPSFLHPKFHPDLIHLSHSAIQQLFQLLGIRESRNQCFVSRLLLFLEGKEAFRSVGILCMHANVSNNFGGEGKGDLRVLFCGVEQFVSKRVG